MKVLRYFLILFWRIWFYILVAVPIILFCPILVLFSSREKWYPQMYVMARIWAVIILFGMGFIPKAKRLVKLDKKRSYMLVANHTSMTDIMLMLYLMKKPFVFVGKKELAKIPVFGFFYKRIIIMVDRADRQSRTEVFQRAKRRLDQGLSICIFPEGGVPDDESVVLDDFKDGAFRLAIDYQIPVLPIVFHDNKKRFPYSFFKGSPGQMRVLMHPAVPTKGLQQTDKKKLRAEIYTIIKNELEKPTV